MYRIINTKTGIDIGFADTIRYIADNGGTYIEVKKELATGIAYKSTPYSLIGTSGIEGLDTVAIFEVSDSDYATQIKKMTDELLLSVLKG